MKKTNVIWIVEDDPGAVFVYREVLEVRYIIVVFETLQAFREKIAEPGSGPDLIIADLRLGNENFLDVLHDEHDSRLLRFPFIIVSSLDDLDIFRTCFDDGALDYLTKPFTRNELIAKVERFLTEGQKPLPQIEDAVLDPGTLTLKRGEKAFTHLTAKEVQLFCLLNRSKGMKVTRAQIQHEVWGDLHVTGKALDVHLFNLRRKLARLGISIKYTAEDGYSLSCDGMNP